MKIAVLCLGYLGRARGVELLARYFARANADIWLHIDSATDATEYETLAARTPSIRLVTPRLRCWWGGFNGARAVLAAAVSARAMQRYDRYLYLTEDSVPLRSISELVQRLGEATEYIVLNDAASVRARYDNFYLWDCDAMCPRNKTFAEWVVTPELERQVARLAALRVKGKVPLPHLRYGGAYWGLSDAALGAILDRHQFDHHFRESFEFSSIPEEHYYHTIIAESGHGARIAHFLYMDFTRDPRPYVYKTRAELKALQGKPYLFARKIDFNAPEVGEFVRELAFG